MNELQVTTDLMPWASDSEIVIKNGDEKEISLLSKYFKMLNEIESKKIINAFKSEMYDMAIEYAWSRAIKILDERLEYFGIDFIEEMTNRENLSTLDEVSNIEKIELAFELGMLNKTARMELSQVNETIYHYMSRDTNEEINYVKSLSMLIDTTKYILGKKIDTNSIDFKKFRDNLKTKDCNDEINALKNAPYFYIKTTIRTILSLIKSSNKENNRSELTTILNNANIFITNLWKKIFIEDKKLIGLMYSQAISNGHKEIVATFSTILDTVQGYDFVPETTRSNAYKKIAKQFKVAHFEFNNFHTEPSYAKKLNSMGTVIPDFALQECLQAVLLSIMGNRWGVSRAAQEYNLEILKKITIAQWKQFFSHLIIEDEDILSQLAYSEKAREKWLNVINEYINFDLNIQNPIAKNIFNYSKTNRQKLRLEASKALEKIIGK